jgi:catechol 2,3-dioxygenase-like lactoylglutathione lyase family enzyme
MMSAWCVRVGGMEPRISFVTLAVRDLGASRAFYVEGLGWRPELEVPGEVVMIRVGEHLILSLWDEAHFEVEVGQIGRGDGVPQFTLAHNVGTPDAVDAVLEDARSAGADVRDAAERDWGGYTGYFADPDGVRWEIAYNPGEIGQSVLPGT